MCRNMFFEGKCRYEQQCRFNHPNENQRKKLQEDVDERDDKIDVHQETNSSKSKNGGGWTYPQRGKGTMEQLWELLNQVVGNQLEK